MVSQDYQPFKYFRKRDGLLVPFQADKIANAVLKAGQAAASDEDTTVDEAMARQIAEDVVQQLDNPLCEYYTQPDDTGERIPAIEDVQDLVEIVLAENKLSATVAAYKRYRKIRERARQAIQVRRAGSGSDNDITDQTLLLVHSASQGNINHWDRSCIVNKLLDKLRLSEETAISVAKEVENQIIASNMKTVDTTLLRAMVNNVLISRGFASTSWQTSLAV